MDDDDDDVNLERGRRLLYTDVNLERGRRLLYAAHRYDMMEAPRPTALVACVERLKKTESRAGTNPGVGAMAARESRGDRLFSLEDR